MSNEESRFTEYVAELSARVTEKCLLLSESPVDAAPTAFREEGFTEVALEVLQDLGHVVDPEICYLERRFGRHAGKLNAWSYDEDEGRLDLVTAVYRDLAGESSVSAGDVAQAGKRALRVFLASSQPVYEEMEPASSAFDMMQRFHQVKSEVERVRIIVLTDGLAGNPAPLDDEDPGIEVTLDVWDLRRLFRAEASGLAYESITIDLEARLGRPLPCLPAPQVEGVDYAAYLAILPGDLLHSLYHEFGPRLLELNVRSFLQARGKVNRGIRDTLKDEPERFLAYNNGISATAEDVVMVTSASGEAGIRSLRGLQVVNGGQTVASIHRAKDRDGFDLSGVFVQAKITVVEPGLIEDLVPQISRYANTQNRVDEADFSANHPFHVKIQQLSETVWAPGEQHRWFYERARGQYQVAMVREGTTPARKKRFDATTPANQRFDKVFLAKYENAWTQLPHLVSRGSQKNFVAFMERVGRHREGWEPDADYYRELVAKAIIFKRAEKIGRMLKLPGLKAQAVAYTVALVSYRTAGRVNLQAIWNRQQCSQALADTIYDWMPQVWEELTRSAGQRNVGEWCKKDECWRAVQTIDVDVSHQLESELAEGQPLPTVGDRAGQKGQGLTPEDRENIARVMQMSAEHWIHLTGWGSKGGHLAPWQIGIATTLATYAAMGWTKVPSAKQAKQAVAMLALADEEDAWDSMESVTS